MKAWRIRTVLYFRAVRIVSYRYYRWRWMARLIALLDSTPIFGPWFFVQAHTVERCHPSENVVPFRKVA